MSGRALAAAEARLEDAKRYVSLAALACLRGAVDAPEIVRKALEEIDGARHLLRAAREGAEADAEAQA